MIVILDTLNKIAKDNMPQGYSIDYGGEARQFMHESGGFVLTFIFAIIIIFLTLAAQFESFRDPLVIQVEGVTKFRAHPGAFKGRKAIQIVQTLGLQPAATPADAKSQKKQAG